MIDRSNYGSKIIITPNCIHILSSSMERDISLSDKNRKKLLDIFREAKWFTSKKRVGHWDAELTFRNNYIHVMSETTSSVNMSIYKVPTCYKSDYVLIGHCSFSRKEVKDIIRFLEFEEEGTASE